MGCMDYSKNRNEKEENNNEYYVSFSRTSNPLSTIEFYPSIEKKYYLGKTISGGQFGSSMIIQNKNTKEEFMLKILDKLTLRNYKDNDKVISFYVQLQSFECDNLVKLIEISEGTDCIFLVNQYSRIGNLQKFIDNKKEEKLPFTYEELRYLIVSVVTALKYLSSKEIYHGHLIKENIILFLKNPTLSTKNLTDYTIKLSDYGHSRYFLCNEEYKTEDSYCDDLNGLKKIVQEILIHFNIEDNIKLIDSFTRLNLSIDYNNTIKFYDNILTLFTSNINIYYEFNLKYNIKILHHCLPLRC